MPTLDGSVALVTGAARRIGRAIALELADAGADIVVHHGASDPTETVEAVEARDRKAWSIQADLSDPHQVDGLLERVTDLVGTSPDIVINNASRFPEARLGDATWEDLDALVRLHAWAPLALSRSLARAGRRSSIVNLLDARMHARDPQHLPYMLSKQTLAALTNTLALELAPHVRVNAVAPGAILPPEGKPPSHLDAAAAVAPLKRAGHPEEVAQAVRFLCEAGFVTGQTIFVDGGRHLV